MTKEEKIKVSFSISVTKSYSAQDISDWIEQSDIDGFDIKSTLHDMVCNDVLDAMRDGKGSFKIIG